MVVFMIDSLMYFGIGFLLAALSVLAIAPLVHVRAVRLTTRGLEAGIPLTMAEVQADKDLLRAEFAMSTRRFEMNIEQFKTKSAGQLAELGRKGDEINRLKIDLGSLRDRLRATEEEFGFKSAAVNEARRALSEKELELAERIGELDKRSTLADAQKTEIITLKTQIEALKRQLDEANNELGGAQMRHDAAVDEARRALSEKESELAERMRELDKRSALANAQKTEIITLKTDVAVLRQQLNGANNELKALEDRGDAARIELNSISEKLMDERTRFESFHGRVAELVQQLMAQRIEDKTLSRRTQELENRFVEQSHLLKESEAKITNLRGEIAAARKVEADLRSEFEGRISAATETFKVEKAKLQAAIDRANGERVRLAYELANIKRQVNEPGQAEGTESPRLSDVAVGGAGRVVYGRLPRRANSETGKLEAGHENRGIH